jgi:hypothetical protein
MALVRCNVAGHDYHRLRRDEFRPIINPKPTFPMNRMNILFLLVTVMAAFDLFRTLHTGRAHGRWSGTITRARQPKRYWRYVYAGCLVLAFFLAAFIWSTLWPDLLSRH